VPRDAQQILRRCDMQGRAVVVITSMHICSFLNQAHHAREIVFRNRSEQLQGNRWFLLHRVESLRYCAIRLPPRLTPTDSETFPVIHRIHRCTLACECDNDTFGFELCRLAPATSSGLSEKKKCTHVIVRDFHVRIQSRIFKLKKFL
jgi:hypothetical protein